MRRQLLLAATLLFSPLGCSERAPSQPSVDLPADVNLKIGQSVRIGAATVTLANVVDGRCPTGANCIHADDAWIVLHLSGVPSDTSASLDLFHTPQSIELPDAIGTFVSLTPHATVASPSIPQSEYVAKIRFVAR